MRGFLAVAALAALAVSPAVTPAQAQTEVAMISFGGATNLPVWIALDRGMFEKNGLKVKLDQTRGSKEQMADLMSGKYQFATTAYDNIVAHTEGQGSAQYANYDLVAIGGVHSGLNSIVGRPEIKTWNDIRGKIAAVDSPKSGYATVLYEILEKRGIIRDKDYTIISVGGTGARVDALKKGTAHIAVVSSPQDMQMEKEGFNILGDAAAALGEYQGSVYATRRSYAKENEKTVIAFMKTIQQAHDVVFTDKAAAIDMLRKRSKGLSEADLELMYKRLTGPGGLSRNSDINKQGVGNVLRLRGTPGDGSKYMDTSFSQKARAN
jgi:ABC-type nitrate/sulfonate/bicarbonate transport system substrate-binding protein